MALTGEWRTLSSEDPTHFNFISSSLVAIQKHSTGPEPIAYQWTLETSGDGATKILSITHASAKPQLYRIEAQEAERIELRLISDEGDDDEQLALVLVPVGMASVNDSLVEDESGVDMGMDLCLTGTAVKLHQN